MSPGAPEKLTSTQLALVIGGLFANFLFFIVVEGGSGAGHNPYTLPLLAAVASLVIAAPFYLSLQSIAIAPDARPRSLLSKFEALVCAVYLVQLSTFVARSAGGQILSCWRTFFDIQNTWPSAAPTHIAAVWALWSVLAVAGGYAGLAAINRFWIPAALAMVVGNAVAEWPSVAQAFASPRRSADWSNLAWDLPEQMAYCLPLTLAVTIVASDAGRSWRAKAVVWRGVAAPIFGTLTLVWLVFAVSVGPTGDGRPFWHYAGRINYPLNAAKGLLFTLTMLPLARFCALALVKLLAPLRKASSWAAAAILVSVVLWPGPNGWAPWDNPWLTWSGLAACIFAGTRSASLPVSRLLKTGLAPSWIRAGVLSGFLAVLALLFAGVLVSEIVYIPFDLGHWPWECGSTYALAFGSAFVATVLAAILTGPGRELPTIR